MAMTQQFSDSAGFARRVAAIFAEATECVLAEHKRIVLKLEQVAQERERAMAD
jgi:hypothetical protein